MLIAAVMICMMMPMAAFATGTTGSITEDPETNTTTVSGDYTLAEDSELSNGETLYVPEGCSLTIPAGKTLQIYAGAWLVNDGKVIVNGTLKSYGLTNFVKENSWPKGEFMIRGGQWYNNKGKILYVGGSGAGLELVGDNASMTAAFVDGALVMTAASGKVVQSTDKKLSSVLIPGMINRLVIAEGATYQVAENKILTVPAFGELVVAGTLEINGSVVLTSGSKYTLKNGAVITMRDEGSASVYLKSGEDISLPEGTTVKVGDVVLDAGQAVLAPDGSISMKNGDRITAQGDIIYHSATITATAGKGGSISPSGSIAVETGQNKTFTIAADNGYRISDVLVDNVSVGVRASYTFEDVTSAHTIEAVFVQTAAANEAETGDDSNMRLWAALMIAAVLGLTGTAVYSRKRKA